VIGEVKSDESRDVESRNGGGARIGVRDKSGDEDERLEEAQDGSHGRSPGAPGRNPWISVKNMDPPRQGRRKRRNRSIPPPLQGGHD